MTESADIKRLSDVKPQPNRQIVEILEEQLEAAKRGDLTGIVIVFTHGNKLGAVGSRWAGRWSAPDAMWALEVWKREVIEDALERGTE